ncbi:MAG: hypothetical protein KQJ78_19855 [Deltaproteobacteria bacterium]|nr:hypothetical protein [Deltaproteobacteria bacterium]
MNQRLDLPPEVVAALLAQEKLCLVGRLLKGVVHNISGAVQMIRLPLDLLEMRLPPDADENIRAKLRAAQEGISRLTEELGLLAAKSTQPSQSHAQTVSLPDLAREQLAFWRAHPYFKHEMKVETLLSGTPPQVEAGYDDLALAFNALVANAVENAEAAGEREMSVCLLKQGREAGLEVTSSGPPPDAATAERMFEPFFGAKGEGHDGLGLFLAREALAPWRGRVEWSATRPRSFVIWLPVL